MTKPAFYETNHHPKTLVLGIQAPYHRTSGMGSYYAEFKNLVRTLGTPYEHELYIKLRTIDQTYFLTTGKMEEINQFCQEHEIKQIIISEAITAQQARNLEDYLDCKITDRNELILEIFERSAHSAEGKAQVAIATLKHKKTRLAGKGIHLSQQTGVTGARGGPGESLKERERRYLDQLIVKFKRQLQQIQKTRETQRKRRMDTNVPHICLIGYTNAGKSTILNTLTKSDVLAEDKLFATLDTTTRELYINKEKKGIISDTVGFIQQLPHHLIEAFKSTLSELRYADLLIHVIDVSDPGWLNHIKVVHEILTDLNVDKEMVYVFNKADQIDNIDKIMADINRYQPHVVVSSRDRKELEPLISFLSDWHK